MANPAYRGLKRLYRQGHHAVMRGLNALGVNVSLTRNFYSAMPVLSELKSSRQLWDRPSELVGIPYDLEAIKRRLAELVSEYGDEYAALPTYEEHKAIDIGPGFTLVDAMVLYMTLRDLKPKQYVEVGSGFSTYYSWLAIEKNRQEGVDCDFRVVDPFPRDRLRELDNVQVRQSPAQAVELEFFTSLGAGDVLFIDTTHVLKVGGEVAFLYLEVVPRIAPGVTVHAHDIHFPYNTPHPAETYILDAKWPHYWTEAMLLQAFLAFNPEYEIRLSTPLIRHFDDAFLEQTLPDYKKISLEDYDTHHGSLWFERVARGA